MTLAGYIDGELAHEDASWSGLLKDRKITKERFNLVVRMTMERVWTDIAKPDPCPNPLA